MSVKLKKFLLALVAAFALPVLVFVSLYVYTWGNYQVPQTVAYDPQLPQLILNQSRFHTESFGSPQNPVVLVVHDGPGSDYRSLLPLKELASQGYRVVFYDQRGSGLSERVGRGQLSIPQAQADLKAFADHFSPKAPLILIGHGWGGMLASAYAGQHPTRVRSLILLEPGFLNTEMAAQVLPAMSRTTFGFIFKASLMWVRSLHLKPQDPEARSDFVFNKIRQQPVYYCQGQLPEREENWRAGFLAWKTLTQSTINEKGQLELDFTKGLKDFKQPVLMLVSTCNQLTGKEFQARQQRFFQQVKQVTVNNSGHEMLLDQPQQSLALIHQHLSSLKPQI